MGFLSGKKLAEAGANVVLCDVNEELLAYTKEKNIPFLGYTENVAEACEDFYESLFPAEE